MDTAIWIICVLAALAIGYFVASHMSKKQAQSRANVIIDEANREAEVIKEKTLLKSREEGLKIESDAERAASQRLSKVQSAEARAKQREMQLNQQQGELNRRKKEIDNRQTNLDSKEQLIESRHRELDALVGEARAELERISGLSIDEAREKLVESLKDEAKTQAAGYINDIIDDAKLTASKEAKRIVIQSIQRVATETAIENSVTVFHIDNDEIKGRIIGREGRNIRALEAATGIEIIVDDTPEAIVLSGFDPVRREIARLALLQHARETANLCAVMASELGLNPKKARRAGLLHDIGKVPDDEPELPHALLGMKLAEKYKEKPEICNAIGAHHDEVEMTSLIAPIVQVCDAISGARPGVRREIVEAYIKRLNDLEQLALSYPGVIKTYAIQAGRELRVIVGADKISDQDTEKLSAEIAKKIQDEMTYPGQVKITVIRETRAVAFAK